MTATAPVRDDATEIRAALPDVAAVFRFGSLAAGVDRPESNVDELQEPVGLRFSDAARRGQPSPTRCLVLALSVATLGALASPSSAQTTMFAYESQTGALAGGQSALYTSVNGAFTTTRQGSGVEVAYSGGGNSLRLTLSAPGGANLVPGVYEGAVRYPFQGTARPGLSLAVNSSSCGGVTGRFVVIEALYGAGGEVQRFAADFEHHCEDRLPALFGSVRINSSVPRSLRVSVSNATSYEGDSLPRHMVFTVALSQVNSGRVTVDYATEDSTAVAGTDYLGASGTLVFPPGTISRRIAVPLPPDLAPEAARAFRVNLLNVSGATIGFGQGTGAILDDDGDRTAILFDSTPGDYIGAGRLLEFTALTGSITATRQGNGVQVQYAGPDWRTVTISAPGSTPLLPGTYETRRFSDQSFGKLDVYGDGRGCNQTFGRVIVREATFETDGSIRAFAADFTQHCESTSTPPLLGAVRINSSVRLPESSASRRGNERLSTGWYHTCAVTSAGGVRCWGDNQYGQLGRGSTTPSLTAVAVAGLSAGVVSVTSGGMHSCALTVTGGVKCWGSNEYGQLGNGSTASTTPVDVAGLSTGVVGISAGLYHTCAVTAAGEVKCWGNNLDGQLGDGTTVQGSLPIDVTGLMEPVAKVSAGGYHTCAVTWGGRVNCWGYNGFGALGDGTMTTRLTPVSVPRSSSSFPLDGMTTISSGVYQTVATTLSGGGKSWGNNANGQLGNGGTFLRLLEDDVSGRTGRTLNLSTGRFHTCAASFGDGVQCWGSNLNGKLGDGTTTQRTSPVGVVGLANGAIGVGAGAQHSCALTEGGGAKCWGDNSFGQLGDGTTTSRALPAFVSGLSGASVGDATVAEGHAGRSILSFPVSLSAPSSTDATISFSTSAGTATSGVDYIATSGVLTIPAGSTSKNIAILVQGDTDPEASETLTLSLTAASGAEIDRGTATGTIANDDPAVASTSTTQYRLYHAGTQEHLYTTDLNEYTVLGAAGWTQEGVAYKMLTNGIYAGVAAVPLFRLYHPGILQHHWTTDSNEASILAATASWFYEGTIGYLLPTQAEGSVPLYRMALPSPPLHLWTTDLNEYNTLATRGWVKEGIIGYVIP
jgi:alpha-tubulin suppressor-like RCC1 family protein